MNTTSRSVYLSKICTLIRPPYLRSNHLFCHQKVKQLTCQNPQGSSVPSVFQKWSPLRLEGTPLTELDFQGRVADVGGPRDRRSPKGQGLSERKDLQHTLFCRETEYCRNLRAFWMATIELSTKVILLWECFQRKSACFWRASNKSQPAFREPAFR